MEFFYVSCLKDCSPGENIIPPERESPGPFRRLPYFFVIAQELSSAISVSLPANFLWKKVNSTF